MRPNDGTIASNRPHGQRRRGRAFPHVVVVALLCTLVAPTALDPPHASAAVVTAVLERTVLLSNLSPPSPDPSGIAWDSAANRFVISDSEVEEMAIFRDANLFELNLNGTLTGTGDVTGPAPGFSNEPTGLSFDPATGHLFLSDDIKRKVFRIAPGADRDFGTADDSVSSFDTSPLGCTDPEDVAFDTATGHLFVADGANREICRVSAGSNGVFDGVPPAGDDVAVNQFDTAQYGSMGSEGLAYDPARNTLLIVDPATKKIFETTKAGILLNTIDLSVANPRHAEDVVLAPSLANPAQMNMYVVARGVDNDANPDENDGKLHELSVSLPSMGNNAPVADAGPNRTVTMPNSITLAGAVSDDGVPAGAPLTSMWSQLPGAPGTATFSAPTSPTTDVSFSAPGTYVLRLTADDSELQGSDDVTVTVNAGNTAVLDIPVAASSDDAEEAASGKVNRVNGDLELALDATSQTVGLRFVNVSIPRGATILSSYIQFRADEKSSTAVTLTIKGQAADSAGTFTATAFGISSRPRTAARATWAPPPWSMIGESGLKQRTTDLSPIVQEIVNRSGWSGGAMVLIVTGDGVGKRTAASFNAGASLAPTLHVEYSTA